MLNGRISWGSMANNEGPKNENNGKTVKRKHGNNGKTETIEVTEITETTETRKQWKQRKQRKQRKNENRLRLYFGWGQS